jgi:hypothetical protein
VRRTILGLLALGAAFLGWTLRDCGPGLGSGLSGWGIGPDEQTTRALLAPTNAPIDARIAPIDARIAPIDARIAPIDARIAPIDAPAGPCQLFLDSAGLKLWGAPASIDDAVRACRATGKASVAATGGARAGSYDELIRALEQAGIAIQLD